VHIRVQGRKLTFCLIPPFRHIGLQAQASVVYSNRERQYHRLRFDLGRVDCYMAWVQDDLLVRVALTFFVLFRTDVCKLTNCSHKRDSIRLNTKSPTAL
jgi:hypothetical protein